MKKNQRIILIAFIAIVTVFSSINFMNINVSYAKEEESLINISECSKSFMANYFEESKEIRESDNKENILIVTSEIKVKDGKGASKIVAAPNNQYILQYNSEEEKDKALKSFKKQKNIVSVEENIVYTIDYWSWGIEKTKLDQAIEATNANTKGINDVTVAVIDTGCDITLFSNTKYSEKIIETYNVLEPEGEMNDNVGHGTHVAGTIAEGTPDNVKILPIKVSDDETIHNTDIIEAINYVVYNNKADVINMSFSSASYSEAIYQAISAANEKNIICVAAAGNDNTSYNKYPAALDNTISISAVDSNLEKASFSNYGKTITFTAPGVKISSLNPNYGIAEMSGTSMAVPHAVSAVAILKGYNKNITLDNTIELLKEYAIDLGDPGWDKYYGYGLISFDGALFCDGKNCDKDNCNKYGVFHSKVSSSVQSIEVTTPILTNYNYGSIYNLLGSDIKLYYTDKIYENKKLWELDGLEINGYDAYSNKKEQTIEIKYGKCSTKIKITNPETYESGWEYTVIDENSIELTLYKDNSQNIGKLYIPQKIDEYNVVSIAGEQNKLESKVFANSVDFADFEEIVLPNTLTKIGKAALMGASKLKKVVIPKSVTSIGENAFKTTKTIMTVWVYKDSYARTYAKENNIKYKIIDSVLKKSEVYLEKNTYRAFETVDTTGMYIRLCYDDGTTEDITQGFTIKYTGDNTSFRYGDTYFTVSAYSQTEEYIEQQVNVTVNKAEPKYTEPTGISAIEGQYLYEIKLPEGFEWMDPSQLIEGYGNLGFKAKYIPEDTDNYLVDEHVYITVHVRSTKIVMEGMSCTKRTYKAFETVDTAEILVTVQYYDGIVEKIKKGINIEYQNGNTSFRYGDTYCTVSAYSEFGKLVTIEMNVTVTKATPQYTIPTGITAKVGQKLSGITLPEGFAWMDESQVIQGVGDVVHKARYTPEDTNNYETVENIDVTINASKIAVKIPTKVEHTYIYTGSDQYLLLNDFDDSKMKITGNVRKESGEQTATISLLNENYVWDDGTTRDITFNFKIDKAEPNYANSSDYIGVYDENAHSINLEIGTTEYNVKYSVNNTNYDLSDMPTFKDIGEYTVNYKITKNNYNDVIGSKKVCIYGVQKLDSTLEIRNNILVIKNYNNNFKDICNRIKLFATSHSYNHYDRNKVLTNNVIANTGDSVKININNLKEYEYAISVLGDVNGDGKISALDYVKIKNHIMKTNLINSDVYLISADVNDDGKISALDYVRIKNRIMNGGV